MSQAIDIHAKTAHERAWSIPLEQINVADPELWPNEEYWPYFERLRKEAPVHYCANEGSHILQGPYWSITRFEDIMAVDTNHKLFSSEPSIVLQDPDTDFTLPMFIAMDPPKHDIQRRTVAPIVAPSNLVNMEALIRERTCEVLDSLPRNEEFDWVDTVSIELTTRMLATLFDFPFEDRRKLTRWSDVATATEGSGIVENEDQRRSELYECLDYFTNLWNERVNAPPKPDLVSMLAHGEDTRNMAPLEYLGNLVLLIVGGNDTTRNSMTGGVYALNKFPAEYQNLLPNK